MIGKTVRKPQRVQPAPKYATVLTLKQKKALRDRLAWGMAVDGFLCFVLMIVRPSALPFLACLFIFWVLFATWFMIGWYAPKSGRRKKRRGH